MKFEEFLMRPSEDQLKRVTLENEVQKLQEKLEGELKLNNVLRWATKGPVISFHCLPPELPFQVRVLLTELAVAEEQIMWLERRLRKLKLTLNHHNTRPQIDDSSRRRSVNGKQHANHTLELKPMSRRTPRILPNQWRLNSYLCGK